ncbi:hypothetical protein [Parapedobacter koreensis]|uniref:Uncharacterized protein n=1 Tax=Parapedobacter koreensis TaxID=332977 RepID=A0A1H7U328_9SPHI|nr:hypothetical protein [Parapedobacter koreensis]SEL90657.1 hypothetical protein SAMN05421740_11332 [Parapedobacter koreensis]
MGWANQLPVAFLPDTFSKEIPPVVSYGEQTFRMLFFILTFMMPLNKDNLQARWAWLSYGFGLFAYFASWLMLIYRPESGWSNSLLGFTAPAWTPALWMLGIAYIGRSFFFGLPFGRWLVLSVCCLFLLFHNAHTYIVFLRIAE